MSLEKHTTSSTANTTNPKPEDGRKQEPVANGTAANGDGGSPHGPLSFAPHTAEPSKVLSALEANQDNGLSDDDAAKRLAEYGPNRIKPPKKPSIWGICLRQIGNAMTLVLSESKFSSLSPHHHPHHMGDPVRRRRSSRRACSARRPCRATRSTVSRALLHVTIPAPRS